ncbi:hypothetical protein [Nonomuraea sp. NPDC005692]|uniref:hypothetical protein n=1 Tax=Nonomuraea sp. NPDC005692 TaxID=3157168 RepID=UPI0034048771
MSKTIDSWADLQRAAAAILRRMNDHPTLARAAAANPVLAIERLGYTITPHARPGITDRLRLGPEAAELLARLRREVERLARRPVDPDDGADVRRALLELGVTGENEMIGTEPPRWRPGGAGADRLEALRDRHEVMRPLLEYRRLSGRRPALAPEAVFEAVLSGERVPAVTAVKGRLQEG